MMSIIADSSKRIYEPLAYTREADFEKQVVALADQIFGTRTIYVDVKKHVSNCVGNGADRGGVRDPILGRRGS